MTTAAEVATKAVHMTLDQSGCQTIGPGGSDGATERNESSGSCLPAHFVDQASERAGFASTDTS